MPTCRSPEHWDRSFSLRRAGLASLVLFALSSASASAQTASQITPRSFEPAPQPRGGGIVIPEGAGPVTPPGAETLSVTIRAVRIDGGLPDLAQAEAAIVARLSGRRVTAAAIFEATRELERAYLAAGYGLVRVLLPAQQLVDGATLRLRVLDGYIERVETDKLPPNIRGRIAALLAPLVGERGIRMATIERRLLLAGELPGTVLRSTLAPGSKPGGGVLVIEARYKPVTAFAAFDNSMTDRLGTYSTSIGFDINSPTGHGEQIYLRAGGLPYAGGGAAYFTGEPRNRSLAAGVTVPVGRDGWSFNIEATDAQTTPRHTLLDLGTTSDFSRVSARLRYALVRSRSLSLNLEGAFDAQEDRVTLVSPIVEGLSLDRLRILRMGSDLTWYAPGDGVVTGRLTGSFGLDGLGARRAPPTGSVEIPLSRQGVRPDFQKLEASLGYTQSFTEHLVLDLRARGQTAFNQTLPRSEQIGLSGPTSLSPLDSGRLQGDDGFVVRGELRAPFLWPFILLFGLPEWPAQQGTGLPDREATSGAVQLAPYGFAAFGAARLQKPSVLEPAVVHASAYGLGLRIAAAPQASFTSTSLGIEYGRYQSSDGFGGDQRLTVSAQLQF